MKQIGQYDITGEAGSGVFGTVFRAKLRDSGEERALRVLPKPGTPAQRNRLAVEVFPASQARQVLDCGLADGKLFVAGPWIDGTPLNQVEPKPPMEERIETIASAADCLTQIHAAGVLHRNLHPGNVFVLPGAKAAIADATLSFLPCAESLGRSAVRLDYLAPEQFLGGPLDGRTDLFALAVIAYEYFSGRHPFPGEGRARAITEDEPVALRSIDRAFPESFDRFFQRALGKDPAGRPASAPEFAAELRRLEWTPAKPGKKTAVTMPVKAAQDGAPKRKPANWMRQVAAGALAAAGVAGAAALVANRSDRVEPEIRTPAPSAELRVPNEAAAPAAVAPPAGDAPAQPETPAVDPARLLRRAEARFNQGNYRGALSMVQTVLAADPANAEARRWRSRIQQAQAAEAKLSQ